jgi:hypothetical protein
MATMWARPLAGFKNGRGFASPALILVWLALGVGLVWLGWYIGLSGITAYSGTVKTVSTDPQNGMHFGLDSSSLDFFFDSLGNSRLPDITAGDHVDILAIPQPEGWSIAVDSPRGTWIDSTYGNEIAPFTPQTWTLHEALRWTALAFGILIALFGLASLLRWIPSRQQRTALTSADTDTSIGPAEALHEPEFPIVQGSSPPSDPATLGTAIGTLTVTVLPILEVIAATVGLGSCSAYQFADTILIGISVALAAGGITTLILSSRGAVDSPRRSTARRLGIVAIVMALASIPINAFLVLLSGFCAVG